MRYIVDLVLKDIAHGDPHALMGLVDYLIRDKHYPATRILKIATKTLHIPETVAINTLSKIYGGNFILFN